MVSLLRHLLQPIIRMLSHRLLKSSALSLRLDLLANLKLILIINFIQELHASIMNDMSSLLQKAMEKQHALLKSSVSKVR